MVPVCHIKAKCGACKYVNLAYQSGLADKFEAGAQVLTEVAGVARGRILPPAESPRQLEYRSLFKLAVRPATSPQTLAENVQSAAAGGESPNRFAIGLFEPGTHDVIDMDDCPLHTAPLKRLLRDLRVELNLSTLTPFDEATHTGQLRYIVARSAHLTGEIMLTFVVTEPVKVDLKRLVAQLQRKEHKINSAHMNINTERGNAIFGAETVRIAGAEGLRERVVELDFEVGPTSFFQVNPWQAINLYRRIEQIAGQPAGTGQEPVAWDLYCGIGQISLVLARLGYRVLGIEENPNAVVDAAANARRNHLTERAEFIASRVEDVQGKLPSWAQTPSLIVVNPSRRGLAESTRRHLSMLLVSNPTSRLVYVSCEVQTLARDLKELQKTGFQVRQIEPFDMFPQTDNMEWLVVMTR
jgi:23S rRNA (uracil1939-C5)-methyltransferase